jgi:phosphomannomutase
MAAVPSGTLMLAISGIRCIVGDSLTPEVVSRYIASFAHLQLTKSKGMRIILVYDTHPASALEKPRE